jgi:ribonuclease HI
VLLRAKHSQIFLVEFTNISEEEEAPRDNLWVIYVDGLSTKKNGGAGVVLITLGGEQLCNSLRLEFKTMNNEDEYEAVLVGLKLAQEMGTKCVEV